MTHEEKIRWKITTTAPSLDVRNYLSKEDMEKTIREWEEKYKDEIEWLDIKVKEEAKNNK
jgi:hypothetical protein